MGKEKHSKKQSEQEKSLKIEESDKIATIAKKLGFRIRDPKKKREKFPDEITLPPHLKRVWDAIIKNTIEWDNKQRGTDMLTPIQLDIIKEREFRKKVENYPLCKQCDFINYKLQKCNIYKDLREYCDVREEEEERCEKRCWEKNEDD